MLRTLLIAITIALCNMLIPVTANAQTSDPAEMSKDAWLGEMNSALPEVVCKGFLEDEALKKRFDEVHISKEKCMGLIPEIATKCQGSLYDKIPAKINDANASTWGEALGECIGKGFAVKYLIP